MISLGSGISDGKRRDIRSVLASWAGSTFRLNDLVEEDDDEFPGTRKTSMLIRAARDLLRPMIRNSRGAPLCSEDMSDKECCHIVELLDQRGCSRKRHMREVERGGCGKFRYPSPQKRQHYDPETSSLHPRLLCSRFLPLRDYRSAA